MDMAGMHYAAPRTASDPGADTGRLLRVSKMQLSIQHGFEKSM